MKKDQIKKLTLNEAIQLVWADEEGKFMSDLCKHDPDLASLAFNVTRHRGLGEVFVEMYKDSDNYHHTAYFMSVEIKKPIPRRNVQELDFSTERNVGGIWPGLLYDNETVCGREVPEENSWRARNQLDDGVRILEDFGNYFL